MLHQHGCLLLALASLCNVKAQQSSTTPHVLMYSATQEGLFRHDSIPTAIQRLKVNQDSIKVVFENTEDGSTFTASNLAKYDAVVFLSTVGEVLDNPGKNALQTYFNSGGNFVGIHSTSDCLRNTTSFVRQLGARFDYHADLQEATVNVIGPTHPSTSGVPSAWTLRDEMYNFESNPRDLGAIVVLSADESSYTDDRERRFDQGSPHPIAWYQERAAGVDASGTAGRSFYTSLGHLNETWQDPVFLSHILGGISWVLQSNTTRAFNSSGLVGNSDASTSTGAGAPTTATSGLPSPTGS
ncbi:class I glutamine amidotransferase-like protein [Coprinellus micaceus]|uniref:Class I glutamine amidotransferase-like protein n=1 Tax=Coprinellus micaceus TaxID=71717 RepID=A0A4Y7TMB1_COPMI|nr:class I glutamine amidotransferase-like protein [Coprinellus micaceus]